MQQLMQWQRDIIINSMVSKSSAQISVLIAIDKNIVADFICAHCGTIITKDQKIAERKVIHEQKSPVKKKKKAKARITSARIDNVIPFKHVQRSYKTRQQNFTLLIPVKIDHKTYIYVKPGSDIEKVKQDFINNIEKSKTFSLTKK